MKFLRYPGGKSKLLFFLANLLPQSDRIKGRYIEPFVGGGSVFLYIQPERAILSDLNEELIDLYKGIRNYPHKVWETFASFPSGKETYYRVRDEEYEDKPLYYRAARTLYLNRTCFKGMWRHNPSGNFNVGYGGEERRWVITHDSIVELSRRLRKATLVHSDFELILDRCSDGDFVFLDPPYKPGEKEMSEAHYINGKFSFEDQVRLSGKLKELARKNSVNWLMTNSSNREICELYNDFNVVKVPVGTSNVIGVSTNNSKEVIISNY
jgi:DNA adenine methylase